MKSMTATAALIVLAFGAAAPGAAARTGAPGAAPATPNKVAAVPTPPPGGPDKLATKAGPKGPGHGLGRPRPPEVVDDLAGRQGWVLSTCYPAAGPNCVASLDKLCTKNGGGMSTNPDGSVTCTVYD